MWIVMVGLPGTGKSTLAAKLAEHLGGVVLSKDVVRAALFPGAALDYSREQDDLTMQAVYAAARTIVLSRKLPVVLDGRTYSRAEQIQAVLQAAGSSGFLPIFIECVAADDVVKTRLERDLAAGSHLAKNRTFELYREVKSRAEPLMIPRLTLDTGAHSLVECLDSALQFISSQVATRTPSEAPTWPTST